MPSFLDYHYRVKQLADELLKSILEECTKLQKGLPFITDKGYDAEV
ncbi:MAG: hypothetical protein JHC21_00885 [Thermocrinis sp.]|nr:hypothetical protein [Thermocrinis sp.]